MTCNLLCSQICAGSWKKSSALRRASTWMKIQYLWYSIFERLRYIYIYINIYKYIYIISLLQTHDLAGADSAELPTTHALSDLLQLKLNRGCWLVVSWLKDCTLIPKLHDLDCAPCAGLLWGLWAASKIFLSKNESVERALNQRLNLYASAVNA